MKKWLLIILLVLTLGLGAGTLNMSTASMHAAPYKTFTRRECSVSKKNGRTYCYNRKYWFWNKASWDSFVAHGYRYAKHPNPYTKCKTKSKRNRKTGIITTTTTCVTVYKHR